MLRLHVDHNEFLLKTRKVNVKDREYSVPIAQHTVYMLGCALNFVGVIILVGHIGRKEITFNLIYKCFHMIVCVIIYVLNPLDIIHICTSKYLIRYCCLSTLDVPLNRYLHESLLHFSMCIHSSFYLLTMAHMMIVSNMIKSSQLSDDIYSNKVNISIRIAVGSLISVYFLVRILQYHVGTIGNVFFYSYVALYFLFAFFKTATTAHRISNCDIILHSPDRSWKFKKACLLKLLTCLTIFSGNVYYAWSVSNYDRGVTALDLEFDEHDTFSVNFAHTLFSLCYSFLTYSSFPSLGVPWVVLFDFSTKQDATKSRLAYANSSSKLVSGVRPSSLTNSNQQRFKGNKYSNRVRPVEVSKSEERPSTDTSRETAPSTVSENVEHTTDEQISS